MFKGFKRHVNRGLKRFSTWYKKNNDYGRSRKISDYRAMSTAEKLILSGALQSDRLTGAPLSRGSK